MTTLVHIENRYCTDEYVAGAAVTFDGNTPTPQSPRTKVNGNVYINTDQLADGKHVMTITPANTEDLPVGPRVAENLPGGVQRTYASLDVDITIEKGKITAVSVPAGQQENGTVGPGTNPVMVHLQPIFFHGVGDLGARKYEDISLIVIHQTAKKSGKTTGDVHATLSQFRTVGSPHYVVTGEAQPQVIKIVRDNHVAGHASDGKVKTSWRGKSNVDSFSIGIEDTHQTNTPWPKAQIDRLIGLLKDLRNAYPSIPPAGIVGHQDVLSNYERDCPGLDFDWVLLEKEGLGMIPQAGSLSVDVDYGGFFQLKPDGLLQRNDNDATRIWGGGNKPWPTFLKTLEQDEPVVTEGSKGQLPTVMGHPIKELQTDLHDIGYDVTVNGQFDGQTRYWVKVFQDHFFAGSRRSLLANPRGMVDRVTAEFIKAVRP
jgi:N-acetyl-anhydromuramyl-L-alanine amidase AmpD